MKIDAERPEKENLYGPETESNILELLITRNILNVHTYVQPFKKRTCQIIPV